MTASVNVTFIAGRLQTGWFSAMMTVSVNMTFIEGLPAHWLVLSHVDRFSQREIHSRQPADWLVLSHDDRFSQRDIHRGAACTLASSQPC